MNPAAAGRAQAQRGGQFFTPGGLLAATFFK
jgi:hypothetical protein